MAAKVYGAVREWTITLHYCLFFLSLPCKNDNGRTMYALFPSSLGVSQWMCFSDLSQMGLAKCFNG